MSVQPTTPAPEATSPAPEAPKPTAPAEPAAAAPTTPPWGDDFDAEKAWNLVQNLRADKDKLSKRETLTDEQKAKLAEYDKVLESQKTAEQKAQDAAAAAEQRAKSLLDRAVRAEVKALASQGFADPEDAAAFLDLSKYTSGEGDVDSEAIKADLDSLLTRKPHLGKLPETRTPAPNPAQGSSGSGSGDPTQLDEAWVKRMAAEGRHGEIVKAQEAGRLRQYLANN